MVGADLIKSTGIIKHGESMIIDCFVSVQKLGIPGPWCHCQEYGTSFICLNFVTVRFLYFPRKVGGVYVH